MKTKLLIVLTLFALQYTFAKALTVVDPVAPNLPDLNYCDSNNDGFGVFDLNEQNAAIFAAQSGAASNYSITYHETSLDAEFGANPIGNPYYNISPFSQTVYYRIRNVNTSAYAVGSFQLIVNPTPVATVPSDYHLCDYTGAIGYESFDLTTVIPEVLGSLDPSSVSVTFYSSQSDADNGTNQITNIGNYVNSTLWQQTLHVNLKTVSTGCYDVVSLHLFVDPIPQSTQPNYPEYAICDYSAPTGYESFDLSSRVSSILLGQTGMDVIFFPSLADAQNGTNQISNPSSFVNNAIYVQTLGIRITNASTGCYVISTMDIRVAPLPQLTAPSEPYTVCDPDGDGTAVFDLTTLIPNLLGGSSYSITFHETQNDAEVNGTTIPNPFSFMNINAFTQTIYARGEDNITGCYSIVPIELQAIPMPIAPFPLPPLRVCDEDSNPHDGITTVDVTQQTPMILALQSFAASNYNVSYYTSQGETTPVLPGLNFNNGQTIWYRVTLNSTGCYASGSIQIEVNSAPFASGPQSYSGCDNYSDPSDGVAVVNLTQFAPNILNGQDPAVFLLNYYTSQADAIAGSNALTPTEASWYETDPDTDTIWVKVENSSNPITPLCYAITTININVERYPNPFITTENGFNTVYVDASNNVVQTLLLNAIPSGNYTYQWYLNGSLIIGAANSTYLVNTATPNSESRYYSVNVENNSSLGCYSMSSIYLVLQSSSVPPPTGLNSQSFAPGATLASIVVSGTNVQWYAFSNNKNSLSVFSTPLPLNTVLVDGTTYYATQTVGGIESVARLPVTVHVALGIGDNEILPIQFAPNPVKNSLTLRSSVILKSVSIYTMLGQKVFEQNYNDMDITIDFSRLTTGNYILKAQGETGQKTVRIVKE